MSLTREIKDYALSLGFCKAGITTAEDFTAFLEEVSTRGARYDPWTQKFSTGAYPEKMLPGAKSIIVLAYDYAQTSFPAALLPLIGRIYLSRAYLPPKGTVAAARLGLFAEFLRERGLNAVPDGNTLVLRPAAARAGVANFGRNNFAYVDGVGSFVTLAGFIVDRELEYDKPTYENRCPPGCRACMDACPTQAIYEPFPLDPARCVGCNNWMRRPGRFDTTIPREIRPLLGSHVHGCDVCQEACPRNKAKLHPALPRDPFLEQLAKRFSLVELLHLSDEFYRDCVRPIMYHYLNDKSYFQRNAAVAIGNTRDTAYVADLVQELSNPSEMVRIHVAWALGQMDHPQARAALSAHTDPAPAVMDEIRAALSAQG